MGDIGPEQQRYEVLPVGPAEPARRQPAPEPEPSGPVRVSH